MAAHVAKAPPARSSASVLKPWKLGLAFVKPSMRYSTSTRKPAHSATALAIS